MMHGRSNPGFGAVACVMVAAFVALSLVPASADLTFGDGPHRKEAEALWQKLPAPIHQVHGTVAELDSDHWRSPGYVGLAKSGGEITLLSPSWDAAYTIHEIGHLVWWQLLSGADRAEWATWWKSHQRAMPRDYARSDSAEGFADCFSIVYAPPDVPCTRLGGVGAGVSALVTRLVEGTHDAQR